MGLAYSPTLMVDFMVNVGRYAIHGSYGIGGETYPRFNIRLQAPEQRFGA